MDFSIIVACSQEGGIGKNNTLPWKIPNDLKHFKTITTDCPSDKSNVVIMGRRTWESLPYKPLPKRINIIVSATIDASVEAQGHVLVVRSFEAALEKASKVDNVHNVFVIGGSRLYEEALKHTSCIKIYITHILKYVDCDVYLPLSIVKDHYTLTREGSINSHDGLNYAFCEYDPFKN
jgi:dihydrofolate reductase